VATGILQCVIGSRLHDLANEDSDYDYASIVMQSMNDILSPFVSDKIEQQQMQSDCATYELRQFCYLASKGNPTILEVLWSPMINYYTSIYAEMKYNRSVFLNSKAILDSHLGYARSQLGRMTAASDKKRIGKAAAAYIRVLLQGESLLKSGTFNPAPQEHRELLKRLKLGADVDFVEEHAQPVFEQLQERIQAAYSDSVLRGKAFEPDIGWIEYFLWRAYMMKIDGGFSVIDLTGVSPTKWNEN